MFIHSSRRLADRDITMWKRLWHEMLLNRGSPAMLDFVREVIWPREIIYGNPSTKVLATSLSKRIRLLTFSIIPLRVVSMTSRTKILVCRNLFVLRASIYRVEFEAWTTYMNRLCMPFLWWCAGDQFGIPYRLVNVSNGQQMLYYGGSSFGYNGVPVGILTNLDLGPRIYLVLTLPCLRTLYDIEQFCTGKYR